MKNILENVKIRLSKYPKLSWQKPTKIEVNLKTGKDTFFEYLATLLVSAVVLTNIDLMIVTTPSMSPYLEYGDIHFAIRHIRTIERGDLVQFIPPDDPNQIYSDGYGKRAIGLPNERIYMESGDVYINGELLDEHYVVFDKGESSFEEITLGESQYFVMGDNRNQSSDSRAFGPIEKETIFSKSVLKALDFDIVSNIFAKTGNFLVQNFGDYNWFNFITQKAIFAKGYIADTIVRYFGY